MWRNWIVLLVTSTLFIGCAHRFETNDYELSYENLKSFQEIAAKTPKKFKVAEITFSKKDTEIFNSMSAFGLQNTWSKIVTPNNSSFKVYIRDALIKELEIADLYSSDSNSEIKLRIGNIRFETFSLSEFKWIMSGVLSLEGKTLRFDNEYRYSMLNDDFWSDAHQNHQGGHKNLFPLSKNYLPI